MRNKLHFISFILTLSGLALLTSLPKIMAARGDYVTYQVRNKDVFRVTGNGAIFISSEGITQPEMGLFLKHESVFLNPSTQSFYINPEITITTTGLGPQGSTTYIEGISSITAFNTSTAGPFFLSAPIYPRTLEILSTNATGYLVMKGTDCFNRKQMETLNFSSGVITQSKTCWIGLSSATITFTPFFTGTTVNSSSTFYLGTSSGFALPFKVTFDTDVFRVTWGNPQVIVSTLSAGGLYNSFFPNQTIIGTAAVNTANNTIGISSMAFPNSGVLSATSGGSTTGLGFGGYSSSSLLMNLWGVERKTIYAP